MRSLLTSIAVATTILTLTSACSPKETPVSPGPTDAVVEPGDGDGGAGGRPLAAPEPDPGIYFRLSEADDTGPGTVDSTPLAEATVLGPEAVADILSRLPELAAGQSVQTDFAFQPGPRPPAVAGETREQTFPPVEERGDPPPSFDAGPLSVPRYSPEGDINTAPRLSLTFSKPMVPLSSHSALAEVDLPVTLEPQPAGQWRWVGTRTLLFEPEGGRFPKATDYRVTVQPDVEAADGDTLSEASSWSFRTPPVRVELTSPSGGANPRQPVIFVGFDQAIDRAAILPFIQARAGRETLSLREASADEIEADALAARLVEQWSSDPVRADRWIALWPESALPLGAQVDLSFDAGLPSAEGPLATSEAQTRQFEIHDALWVTRIACSGEGWEDNDLRENERRAAVDKCTPFGRWEIDFNNPLEVASIDLAAITIEPGLPGRRVEIGYDSIVITGASVGRSRYTVSLPAGIRDSFGQALGEGYALSFETGDMNPALALGGEEMLVLDPAAEGRLTAYSINNSALKVRLYRVSPEDWNAYQIARRSQRDEEPVAPPGELAWEGEVKPSGDRDAAATAVIDLTPALNTAGQGQVLAVIEPAKWSWKDDNWGNRPLWRWVQATDLGLDAVSEAEDVTAWVTELGDGQPAADVDVALSWWPSPGRETDPAVLADAVRSTEARSDGDGLAVLDYPPDLVNPDQLRLVARRVDDLAFLPYGIGYGSGWLPSDRLAWYVLDDRGLYKPGEEAHLKGWVRYLGLGKGGDVGALTWPDQIGWVLVAANGEEMGTGSFDVTPLGGFSGVVPIPEAIELGDARLQLNASGPRIEDEDLALPGLPGEGLSHHHVLSVAEFRRPEFAVSTRLDEPKLIFGDTAYVTAKAEYYAGGVLPGADTLWDVSAQPAQYSPPGHDGFVFGRWQPWWYGFDGGIERQGRGESFEGRTDAVGEHRLAVAIEGAVPVEPASFRAQATIMDVNRQAWTASSSFLVHPAHDYVGLRVEKWFTDPNEPLAVEAIVADIDGAVVTGSAIQLAAERIDGRWSGETWVEEALPAGSCDLTSAEAPVSCDLSFDTGGRYRLTAEIVDAEGRPNQSQLTIWVAGGKPKLPRGQGLELQEVQLIPDADDYQPGDTARILVQAPFAPARGLWSLRRSGLVEQQAFEIDGTGSATLEIPIEDAYTPNIHLQVELAGESPRLGTDGLPDEAQPSRPAYASGSLALRIPPRSRTLEIEASPRDSAVVPGGETTVDVTVRDAAGEPMPESEVALIVVDEAILALTSHDIGDPIRAFYPERGSDVRDERLRRWIQLADLSALQDMSGMAEMGGGGEDMLADYAEDYAEDEAVMEMAMGLEAPGAAPALSRMSATQSAANGLAKTSGEAAPPIVERSNLNPLAAFVPDATTDSEGRVAIDIELPDNVTRYRIWALATDGDTQFGKAESSLTARLPLIIRPSAPRFLNFGDRFELPLVVQNQTEGDLEIDVVVRAANLALEGATEDPSTGQVAAGQRSSVPAGDRVEIRFPASAVLPGTAALQVAVVSGDLADAQRLSLPVWTPATTEAFATYGEVDEGAISQPVERPPAVVGAFGGLELTTSSTALSALTDAYLYLFDYPFEHEEATASRLMASVALVDVLDAFGADGIPDRETVDARIDSDIERLAGRQNSDGGWGWWPSEGRSSPFTSVHAAHALARAAAKDFAVDEATLTRSRDYLQVIDSHMQALEYGWETRLSMRAYALYVRTLSGDVDAGEAGDLYGNRSDLRLDGQAWLLSVMSAGEGFDSERAELRRELSNAATEEAGTAQFSTGYAETESAVLLASDRRTDAIALDALMADQPDSDLIPKLVRGLLGHRTKGRWGSTQENAWVLLALDRYFRTYEAETPDFTASTWLGDDYVGASTFQGRTADRDFTEIPMALLPADAPADVVIDKQGPGRLYYRLGLRYAPEDLDLEPLERGFSVERVYEAVDDPDDVRRTADGGWEVKAGARVRVRLTMVAPARRYHVALVDPLPAGLEALNPDLATTGDLPEDEEADENGGAVLWPWWRWWRWYDHEAFRDARVEAFSQLLWDGVHSYTYIARATTPGDFVVPPAKAEELFHPETFGRSGSDRLRVVVP